MGEIADTRRSALRELAQADARLYRGLAEELGDGAPATEAQLLALKGDLLQELCAQRGIKVAKRARKDVMVGLLLADPNGPAPLSLLPPPRAKPLQVGKERDLWASRLAPLSSRPWSSASFAWSTWCC